jgi:hypothetical protein
VRSLDTDEDEIAIGFDVQTLDTDKRRARLVFRVVVGARRVCVREGPEVTHPDEGRGGLTHMLDVQGISDPPDVLLGEGGSSARDLIQVAPLDRVVTGVETMRDDVGREDMDVGGQFVIEAKYKSVRRNARADIEMGDLRQRMDPGVGPPRSVQLEVLPPGDRANGPIDLTLDGAGVLLDLPTAVARSGVLDGQLETRHADIVCAPKGASVRLRNHCVD